MREATESASQVRKDMIKLRVPQHFIAPDRRCDLSGEPIYDGPFYIFPDGYAFSAKALLEYITPLLTPKELKRLNTLRTILSDPTLQEMNAQGQPKTREELTADLNDIIACDNPLCGDVAIRSIGIPFFETGGDEDMSWL